MDRSPGTVHAATVSTTRQGPQQRRRQLGARQVLARMELLRRRQESRGRGWPARWWSATKSVVLRRTVGYGYSPGRSVVWLVLLVTVGWPPYRAGYFAGNIAPSDKDAYSEFKETHRPPGYYEPFQAVAYSFENSFPLVKLGQADRWQPDPSSRNSPGSSRFFISASFLLWFRAHRLFSAGSSPRWALPP